ncbi:hypothetical protein E2C01_033943 [Portunus trituberculatus]|uniref:Uncharacterized protein n=1 Tax=Portunus trituberculatus TaxID=210409 RepID=A0A5B7F4A9_PORTR|nr:hypothetical protein [Portunus trituberculatus]
MRTEEANERGAMEARWDGAGSEQLNTHFSRRDGDTNNCTTAQRHRQRRQAGAPHRYPLSER